MVVQFICRGNVFRSLMAETYLRSRQVPGLVVYSSGTVAAQDKAANADMYPKTMAFLQAQGIAQFAKKDYGENISQAKLDESDVIIFMDKIAYGEAAAKYKLPAKTYIWDIADMDYNIRTPEADYAYREKTYQQIVHDIDKLLPALA